VGGVVEKRIIQKMASWLKKTTNETTIHHTSDIPYFLTDEFALICDNNIFTEKLAETDSYMSFKINKNLIKRQSANYLYLTCFPFKVANEKIEFIHNDKKEISNSERPNRVSIALINASYAERKRQNEISNLVENYDKSFIFSKNAMSDEKIHAMDFLVNEHILHGGSWHKAILSILDRLCLSSSRSVNWTKDIPDIMIELYGIRDFSKIEQIKKAFIDFDIEDKIDLIIK